MKPVVVAWALLFVVAVGVLYRFGSWIGRRRRRSPRHSTKAEELDETPPDPKSTETPPVVVARAPETAVSPTRPATPNVAASPARVTSAPEVRQSVTASAAAAKPPPYLAGFGRRGQRRALYQSRYHHACNGIAAERQRDAAAARARQAGCWKRGGYDVTEACSSGSCSARGTCSNFANSARRSGDNVA